jgi:hypothetical protein
MNISKVIKMPDGTFIVNNYTSVSPIDGRPKYEAIKQWIAEGNTVEVYFEPEPTYVELRQSAYKSESDPIKTAIENEALFDGVEPDYTAWIEKVAEIKNRYPKI